jgi:tripartite-type tricarboxylate transporter receptor subunit TctC
MNPSYRHPIGRRSALQALGALSIAAPAWGQAGFPSRPLRIIVGFSPGSSTDLLARLVGERLAEQLKQPVVVENRVGAAGVIGAQALAQAAPDGYTIGIGSLATMALVPATSKDVPYDAVRDFAPLSELISVDLLMTTGMKVPATTVAEFVAWAKAQPNPIFMGTFGAGTSAHFAGFLFGKVAGIKFEVVHYKNQSDGLVGLINGDVHFMVPPPTVVEPHVKSGKLRALATNGKARLKPFPEVPTFAELGMPGITFSNWVGLMAPAKTPQPILDRLAAEIQIAANAPNVRAKMEEASYRLVISKPDEFAATIRKDGAFWAEFVKTSGFTL